MAKHVVVTIGRQFGSGGHEIGNLLAERLDIPLYDNNLVRMAAERLGIREATVQTVDETTLNSFLTGYVLAPLDYSSSFQAVECTQPLNEQVYDLQCEIIRKLAAKGSCVMVGRCADYVLKDQTECLNVFIYAEKEDRIKRIAQRYDLSERKAADKIKEFFAKNKKVFLWLGVGIMVLILFAAGISSCTAMFSSTGSAVIASSYLSEDEAMLDAEARYCEMEAELQRKLDNYEATHNYDEYHFDLDDIEHDPYVLISILSALHEGEFTLSEVQGTLDMLFEKQYILTEEVIRETRYRTETRTGTRTVTDPDTGESHTETYTYTVRVPYDYYICNVTLENFNLSHVPVYIMSQDELSMYATYMSVVGNREDLFPDSGYVDKYITNPPADYTVNPDYLTDETFATLIAEAEKYLNYPYVWGGSNPSTSFDCSGFVSYVLTNSGLVNTGRLGAQGLYNVCTPVSKANAKPGDLIFFVGTYDTPGVSHVGIYVGDNVMLHCGDPIQYTSISSSYWQSHFYAFGRPDY